MHVLKTLANGLRVVVSPQPQLHRAHVALYARVGSRFEDAATNGISHFLEHMIYRGTTGLRSAHEVNDAFERLGGYLYAATHTDFGVFSVTLPSESADQASALFGRVLREPAFSDIEVEKGIVCEEILEDLDDEGRQVNADNLSRAQIYRAHPLGFTITGSESNVRSFEEPLLRAHHARHYVAAGSVLAYSGALTESEALTLAERDFSALPAGSPVAFASPAHAQKKARLRIVDNVSSQTELRVCFRALSETSPQRPALDMLMRIIDDGMSTRLYHRICDEQGLCYDVSAGFDGYEDDGVVDFAAGVQHARTTQVTGEILELMRELAEHGPTDEELAKARKRHRWEMKSMVDSAEDLAGFYAGGLLWNRFETPEQRAAILDGVTRDDVVEMARLVARPERLNVVAVGLLENGEDQRLTDLVRTWKGAAG